ncbi:F0F1 ATP synthase subunit delta [Sedimenticola selenatireducens]|uniref:ATP synthase subunit delta n=1 Tax=Sedimenticola selenatireducens TaxID=191960 RepID=A0A2N6CU70_9GAMM|nr:F0F1 ATP synthase subunit delta [Sedimenticola selenatireducens]PLX60712.1 MAG: F0F1 ATP synthase subunit delta [Sedimenticola selenatireducens]
MAGETTTIARPYAEAVFNRAKETDALGPLSETLEFLEAVVGEPTMAGVITNPKLDRSSLTDLIIEIGGDHFTEEGKNLVKVLIANGRLTLAGEIAKLYEQLKAKSQRIQHVHVTSAFALEPTQETQIADALKAKLGYDITITSEENAELIGGVHIRAGDMVIDGSVSGQLQQLANELGI